MRDGRRIGVIIPALNEENAIGLVIGDIPAWVDEIVVADNGSGDATVFEASKAGARVVSELERGYGAACQRGLQALEAADVVVFVDGDYSDDPRQMSLLVDPILSGTADLVIGSRVMGRVERGALLPQQRFGNWLACRLMRYFFGASYSDLGPFRAIRAGALENLAMQDRAFGWTVEMQVKAARTGIATMEVPVSYRRRIGVSKISGTVCGTILAGLTILRVIFKFRHANCRAAA
ncbi:glycosyltransferase family 2 protein [Hyphomicrobium sp. NDB2Meth4]|uniref:glycosyltransferase family 2 protein n=1 Tax=Hyphomicrobium sp. NDB2Meth4 TaxID=1892846 RepID=UPI0009319C2E|nr:glycosyltransferase family 2 protein [Hyphomicrobium sp. NDB2Meth4]